MDSLIKIEEYENGMNVDCDDPYFIKSLFKNFQHDEFEILEEIYNHSEFSKQGLSSQPQPTINTEAELLATVQPYLDLRNMNLNQIKDYVQQYYSISTYDVNKLEACIRKKKMILKRQHAKNKSTKITNSNGKYQDHQNAKVDSVDQSKSMQQISQNSKSRLKTEGEAEVGYFYDLSNVDDLQIKKKKRNRMSAQISRDRKKQYISDLETEANDLKRQNQMLKEQLTQEQSKSEEKDCKIHNNKFIRLLVLIGVFSFLNYFHFHQNNPAETKVEETMSEEASEVEEDKNEGDILMGNLNELVKGENRYELDDLLKNLDQKFPLKAPPYQKQQMQENCLESLLASSFTSRIISEWANGDHTLIHLTASLDSDINLARRRLLESDLKWKRQAEALIQQNNLNSFLQACS